MKLDTNKMHHDILKRLNQLSRPQRYLTNKLGVSRSTFWRLSQDKDITVKTFLTLVKWLDKPIDRYIK